MHKLTKRIRSPFMKRLTLPLALVLILAACGDDTGSQSTVSTAAPGSTTTATTVPTETTTTAAAATTVAETPTTVAEPEAGLVITSVSFVADMAVITNFGSEAIDLAGHWLCQRPFYVEIPSVVLEPGEAVSINLGSDVFLPIPGTKTIDAVLDVGGLEASSGELALYSSNTFGSAAAIVSYLEWGNGDHGRSSVAVEAGIWPAGGFVPTTPDAGSIFAISQPPVGPEGYDSF